GRRIPGAAPQAITFRPVGAASIGTPSISLPPTTGGQRRRMAAMKQRLQTLGRWFDARLSLRTSLWPMLTHPVPKELAGPMGWWYVFGSASLTMLTIQILTGIGL